jgi:hypothetical protein
MSLTSKHHPVEDVATPVASDKIDGTFRSTSIGEINFFISMSIHWTRVSRHFTLSILVTWSDRRNESQSSDSKISLNGFFYV